jgi:hypothetical protein
MSPLLSAFEDLQRRVFSSIASCVYGGGREDVWIERGVRRGYDGHQNGIQLVFSRSFDGWEGPGRTYVEVNQEYAHITGIQWRLERYAYCRFDQRGDLENVHKDLADPQLAPYSNLRLSIDRSDPCVPSHA